MVEHFNIVKWAEENRGTYNCGILHKMPFIVITDMRSHGKIISKLLINEARDKISAKW